MKLLQVNRLMGVIKTEFPKRTRRRLIEWNNRTMRMHQAAEFRRKLGS